MMRRSNTAIQNIANNNNNNNSNNVTPINTPLRGGNVSGGSCGSSGGCSGYGGGNSGEGKEKYYAHKRNFQTKLNEMDQTDSDCDGVGYRSPCVSLQQYHGSTSPAGQGRSVREFEEQMATLRKENFNLKLRLYFIEESIPGYHQGNAADGQEAFSKQLIEAKVEMEMLRKEIQEKQEILKEAAQAMNQMEKIQKDTETKSQAMVDELKQKIQYLEMEREMKPNSGDLMNNLLGFSNISENMNALQRMRELEGMVRQSDDRINEFQNQLSKMDEMLSKRDETIKEYEDKVKELVFQNAELLESLENKDKEVANAERILRGLRQSNAHLKEDNVNLTQTLKNMQDKFCNEMANMKMYERQMRDQQETLSKMQATIAIKTQNTARLLERIQDYEKMVTKMNFERNLVKRENRFFRAIIGKLQSNKTECYTIEKEIYQQIGSEYTDHSYEVIEDKKYDVKARGDYQREYKLKEKVCLNYCNHCHISSGSMMGDSVGGAGGDHIDNDSCCGRDNGVYVSDYQMHGYCDGESDMDPEIPIRYTISDVSLYGGGGGSGGGSTTLGTPMSKTNSCSSLHANISSTSFLGGSRELPKEEIFMKDQQSKKYPVVDGIRYVYSKFGNFQ